MTPTGPAQQGGATDDFRDLDDWTAQIRRAAGSPTQVDALQMRVLIARHPDTAREILAALDQRRST